MVIDKDYVKKFYNEMYKPYLQGKDNAFLFCIAARKKYLKENDSCKLANNADIIERKTLDRDDFDRFETKLLNLYNSTYLDVNNNPIPDYAKVLYVQLNPIDLKSTYCDYLKKVVDFNTEIINSTGKPITSHTMTNLWYTSMQTNTKNKIWFDFDIDLIDNIGKDSYKKILLDEFKQNFPEAIFHILTTRGGFHLLVKKDNMNREFNPNTILDFLYKYDSFCSEIKLCKSNFIPCPGTSQGEFIVEFD